MGAANCKVDNSSNRTIWVTQYNYSDHWCLFGHPIKLRAGQGVPLAAASDFRGLRFGVWTKGLSEQSLYSVKNQTAFRTLETGAVEQLVDEKWLPVQPYSKRPCYSDDEVCSGHRSDTGGSVLAD